MRSWQAEDDALGGRRGAGDYCGVADCREEGGDVKHVSRGILIIFAVFFFAVMVGGPVVVGHEQFGSWFKAIGLYVGVAVGGLSLVALMVWASEKSGWL
jgi:hypothetical protein